MKTVLPVKIGYQKNLLRKFEEEMLTSYPH